MKKILPFKEFTIISCDICGKEIDKRLSTEDSIITKYHALCEKHLLQETRKHKLIKIENEN